MNTKKNHDWVSQPRPKRTENRYNEKKVNRQTNIQTYRDYVQKKNIIIICTCWIKSVKYSQFICKRKTLQTCCVFCVQLIINESVANL